jgi:hypothetical protein
MERSVWWPKKWRHFQQRRWHGPGFGGWFHETMSATSLNAGDLFTVAACVLIDPKSSANFLPSRPIMLLRSCGFVSACTAAWPID